MAGISRKGERAVVLGGGIAGLTAAGVLASHFEQVTILERDRYAAEPSVRPHAPQGAHVHILLAGGLFTLTRLVPQLPTWLDEMGLPEGDLTHNMRVASGGAWLAKVRSGVPFRACTRPMLEHLLVRDVEARANVELWTDCTLTGLGAVPGALEYTREGETQRLRADLIVDASGRSSRAPKWLVAAGAAPAAEEIVDAGVVYTSCTFEVAAPFADDWTLLATSPRVPDDPLVGALMRVGERRVLAALVCYGRPKPPTSVEAFVDQMRKVSVPEPWQILRDATPVTDVVSFSGTRNRLRRFDAPGTTVERCVVIGDALCSLNPRYGQGMTVAALGAVLGGPARSPEAPLRVGSVKTNLGHLEAAAGIAGFIKTALALDRGYLPPSLHFDEPNPHIPFADLRLAVQTELAPWTKAGPRRAGVSAFGWGGTNCHVVVESAPRSRAP